MIMRAWTLSICLAVALSACTNSVESGWVHVELDKRNDADLVRYYVASFVSTSDIESFVRFDGNKILLNVRDFNKVVAEPLVDSNADRVIDWDEWKEFVQVAYNLRDDLPQNVGEIAIAGTAMRVSTAGVMTDAIRTVSVSRSAVRKAVDNYEANGRALVYEIGTKFVAQHVLDDHTVEYTAMIKREDGYWDFVTYDSSGVLASSTISPPKQLSSPTQCVGCHFGSRLFEPEKSFPAEAPLGPSGPRAVFTESATRRPEVVSYFDEHRKRSDRVLGLYATLFVSEIITARESGNASDDDLALLDKLGL